jgi:ferrochelatase
MTDKPSFDAILLVSFGGPEGPDDVVPFLENVTRGRNIPRKRLEQVGKHYFQFGGISPINERCRRLIDALKTELEDDGPRLPIYWGNRNWHPMIEDTVAEMTKDGVRRAVAVATSAFSSYSSCRQYIEDIERARQSVGKHAPIIEKIPPYWNHPGFIETMVAHTSDALERMAASVPRVSTRLVFTAHSIPMTRANSCDYVDELNEAAAMIAERTDSTMAWDLVYQSRSGSPAEPWLEPDVCDHLRELHSSGVKGAVVVPIGFTLDHMEVIYDLDTEARAIADEIGLVLERANTVGDASRFVKALRDLINCHIEGRTFKALGTRGAKTAPCPPGCCAFK